jgi:hypothetical protein
MIGRVRCPKCRADVTDSDAECPHCGIVFAKYREREEPLPSDLPVRIADVEDAPHGLVTLLRGVESPTAMPVAIGRALFLLLLSIGTMTLASRAVLNQVSLLRGGRVVV